VTPEAGARTRARVPRADAARKTGAEVRAPRSEAELLARAASLAGHTLGELAALLGAPPPPHDARRAKGLAGHLVERALGAKSGSRAGPDFPALGIELKTIPVDRRGRPAEVTFVCMVPQTRMAELEWEASPVQEKLRRVLFVPIERDPSLPLSERRIGAPRLWSPSRQEQAELRADFELLASVLGCGGAESLTSRQGLHLHVRPKGRDSRARVRGRDELGAPTRTLPRGFYLRASFTVRVLGGCARSVAQHDDGVD
jgi:DNA mismatch repair protein MutH